MTDGPTRHLSSAPPPDEPPYDPYDRPGRQPPQDMTAEQSVLGAMLISETAIGTVRAELDPDDFYRPAHETIYATVLRLADRGEPVDMVTVANALRAAGELERVGGAPYIHTLASQTPTAANAEHYAGIVRNHARLRAVVDTGTRLTQLGYAGNLDQLDHILGEALQRLDETVQRWGPRVTAPSTWTALDLESVLAGNELDPPPSLLARDDGQMMLYRGAVHTVSGEPGSGKTWLTLVAAVQQLRDQQRVTMLDFEDRASRVIGRLLALGATPDQVRAGFRYVRPHAALDAHTRADLEHVCTGSTLIIIDGVTEVMSLHGLDLSSNPDVARFYDLLPRPLADLRTHTDDQGPAVVLIDHVVKDSEKQGRWALGGGHKLAGIDGVSYLVRLVTPFGRGKQGHARVTVAKDRPGYVEEVLEGRVVTDMHVDGTDPLAITVELRVPEKVSIDETGNFRPTFLMERVSKWLEISPGAGKRAVLEGVTGSKKGIQQALAALITEGYVAVENGPNRSQRHRSITPFRQAGTDLTEPPDEDLPPEPEETLL